MQGQKNCFAAGLTTLDEAGLGKDSIETLLSMQKDGRLKMRIYAMISDHAPTLKYYFEKGPYKSERLNVRAVKVYADGTLGSRGACMKSPYNDLKNHYGFLLQPPNVIQKIADDAFKYGFQLCTHAIGDSANKLILDIYAQELKGKNDKRWRIEH